VESGRRGARLTVVRGSDTRKKIDVKLLIASLGIAVGLVLVVLGLLSSETGGEQLGLPAAIESVDPITGATQVPQQTRVFVDLVDGYEAVLVIDGVELPNVALDDVSKLPPGLGADQETGGDQIDLPDGVLYEPGNNTYTYVPDEDALVEPFSTGQHTATVIYWKTADGRQKAQTYSWNFYVV
jgi:hypothetical protein